MQLALLSCSASNGDAVGNQIAEKVSFFLDRGAEVRVFLGSDGGLPFALRPYTRKLDAGIVDDRTFKYLSTADLIFVEYSQWFEILNWLPLLAGGKGRIVFDYHGVTPPHLWGRHNREAIEKGARQRGLVWSGDTAIIHSRFAQRELLFSTGYPQAWTRQLGYPVDLTYFSPGIPQIDWRERLGLGSARLLLFVGRLAPNKRVPILIEALAGLKDDAPPIHALVVGDTVDTYAAEAELCRHQAETLGVNDRVHLVGRLNNDELLDAYHSANLFVMPSVHEGFCIPIIEAMACGVPVLAARAAALPETLASAGLTFHADDVGDFVRQIRRVLSEATEDTEIKEDKETKLSGLSVSSMAPSLRIAFVAFRFGGDFVGGAESSLRTAALALRDRGHQVEVFTTCTNSEGVWSNTLKSGTTEGEGLPIHRFPIDSHDRSRHLESLRKIMQATVEIPFDLEDEYLQNSIHSTPLIAELSLRSAEFDAVIVGPYLHGLTCDVAKEFPEKTIVVPCIHDEPLARFRTWPTVYGAAAGMWFHSEEEKKFAEAELGLNHPGGVCIGTWLDTETSGDGRRGQKLVGANRPYLVYAGRYSEHKNLPTLLEFAQRYHEANPNRFTFVFLGEGHVKIPHESWAHDLGFIENKNKRDVIAGAAALIQLSRFESLSLVALEAWAQGTPVLADRRCAVLMGHLDRSSGGQAVDSYESFADALDDLGSNPGAWKARGGKGRQYVRENYGSRTTFAAHLEACIRELKQSMTERMQNRGLERAALFSREIWREKLGRVVEEILDSPPRPRQDFVEVSPRTQTMSVAAGQEEVLVPVQLTNRGTHIVAAEGPGRYLIRSHVGDGIEAMTALPDLLMPGQKVPAAATVPVPSQAGTYQVSFQVVRNPEAGSGNEADDRSVCTQDSGRMELIVGNGLISPDPSWSGSLQHMVRAALVEANRCARLPDDYTDITEGRFAQWKRWIKRKLLGNFKHAYVDVMSRQQSRFNQQVLTALTELADYCATLEHVLKTGVREQESGVRDQKSEIRSQRSEVRDQGLEVRGQRLEHKDSISVLRFLTPDPSQPSN
jgi:glycosyltransferase involved in cell wall biosynthesis